jgi:hypothetical protein
MVQANHCTPLSSSAYTPVHNYTRMFYQRGWEGKESGGEGGGGEERRRRVTSCPRRIIDQSRMRIARHLCVLNRVQINGRLKRLKMSADLCQLRAPQEQIKM